jgi:hypothetical protein
MVRTSIGTGFVNGAMVMPGRCRDEKFWEARKAVLYVTDALVTAARAMRTQRGHYAKSISGTKWKF